MISTNDIEQAYRRTVRDGGATLSRYTLAPVAEHGWAVGGADIERRVATSHTPSHERYDAFAHAIIEANGAAHRINARAVGTWLDDAGDIVIDVVDIVETAGEAIELGFGRGEDAIYHLASGRTVWLREPKERAA